MKFLNLLIIDAFNFFLNSRKPFNSRLHSRFNAHPYFIEIYSMPTIVSDLPLTCTSRFTRRSRSNELSHFKYPSNMASAHNILPVISNLFQVYREESQTLLTTYYEESRTCRTSWAPADKRRLHTAAAFILLLFHQPLMTT